MGHPGAKQWNPAWGRGLRKIPADPEGRGGTRTGQGRDKKGRRRGAEGNGRGPSERRYPEGQRRSHERIGTGPRLTLLAGGRRCAPGQVPLASENVGAEQLVAWLALVSKHRAPDQVPMGSRPPAPLRRGQLGARVVPRDLCRGETASWEAVRLRTPFLLGALSCQHPCPSRDPRPRYL